MYVGGKECLRSVKRYCVCSFFKIVNVVNCGIVRDCSSVNCVRFSKIGLSIFKFDDVDVCWF